MTICLFHSFYSESNSHGMIINRIIKHLLPAAPALSRMWTPPETPWLEVGGEENREGGRDTGGARGRGCRERRAADPEGSPSHCWILSHSETRLQHFSPLKLCDQNKRNQDGRIRPPLPWPNLTRQPINSSDWLFFDRFESLKNLILLQRVF